MKIAYVTPYKGEEEIVKKSLADHEVIFIDTPIENEIPENLHDVEVLSLFVNSKLTKEMVDEMPSLKVIALRSMGYDHVPVDYAKEKGIVVTYVPQYGAQTVAEHAFTLMLSLSRKVPLMYDLLRREGNINIAEHEGFDLAGKTLGVIGTGNIGKRVCEIAKGFRMNVVAYDLYPDKEFANKHDILYETLTATLAKADIVTLHIPASDDNKHLINSESIETMKDSAYLINTARGSLVDTVSLLQALKSNKLAGAGLDVFEGETYLKDEMKLLDPNAKAEESTFRAFVAEHELLDMDNVVMTPHMAFNTKEAKREITDTTTKNITTSLAGEPAFPVN